MRLGGMSSLAAVGVVLTGCSNHGSASLGLYFVAGPAAPATAWLSASAVKSDGSPGTGSVNFTSTAGNLVGGHAVTLDATGSALTSLTCDPAAEAACGQPVTIEADWTPDRGPPLAAYVTRHPPPLPSDGGSWATRAPGDCVGVSGAFPASPVAPIDPVCATSGPRINVFPPATILQYGVLINCANGFELNNATFGADSGIYTLNALVPGGSCADELDVDFATYLVPDGLRVTGVTSAGQSYLLIDSCELQTWNSSDPTGGQVRPPGDTIRQIRVVLQPGTIQLNFDFRGVVSPMYVQVLGLCDFAVTPYSGCQRWRAIP